MVAPRSDPSRSAAPPSAFGRLAGKVGGHSLVYALAAGTAILGGLAGLAVFTRYLGPRRTASSQSYSPPRASSPSC